MSKWKSFKCFIYLCMLNFKRYQRMQFLTFTLYFPVNMGKSLSEVHPWLDGADQGTETESKEQESGAGQEIS